MTTNTIEKNFFLTPHFSLKEMTASATANQLHIINCPNATQIARLKALCEHVLEPLRQHFGAIRITSGFRSERLNDAAIKATDAIIAIWRWILPSTIEILNELDNKGGKV